MTRTKLKDRKLPKYSKGEEIFNMTSHIVGAVIGLVAMVLCIVFSGIHRDSYAVVSSVIYGITMILLYTISSIYHGLNRKRYGKRVLQVIDHCSIFLLIAGSYTPFCLCTLRENDAVTGWTLFGIVWLIAILGIVLNSIDLKKYKKFSMVCYIAMGWCVVFKIPLLISALHPAGFTLLLLGGIAYTVGAILYGLGKKKKWMHSVFHVACVIGTLLQFLCILLYVV